MVLKACAFKKTMAMSSKRTEGDQRILNSEILFLHVSYAVAEMLLLFGLYISEAQKNRLHNHFRKDLCG